MRFALLPLIVANYVLPTNPSTAEDNAKVSIPGYEKPILRRIDRLGFDMMLSYPDSFPKLLMGPRVVTAKPGYSLSTDCAGNVDMQVTAGKPSYSDTKEMWRRDFANVSALEACEGAIVYLELLEKPVESKSFDSYIIYSQKVPQSALKFTDGTLTLAGKGNIFHLVMYKPFIKIINDDGVSVRQFSREQGSNDSIPAWVLADYSEFPELGGI